MLFGWAVERGRGEGARTLWSRQGRVDQCTSGKCCAPWHGCRKSKAAANSAHTTLGQSGGGWTTAR
eukprot:12351244-Alexandrium_andersonii.AAC.1